MPLTVLANSDTAVRGMAAGVVTIDQAEGLVGRGEAIWIARPPEGARREGKELKNDLYCFKDASARRDAQGCGPLYWLAPSSHDLPERILSELMLPMDLAEPVATLPGN
jgi:hypothetical protein